MYKIIFNQNLRCLYWLQSQTGGFYNKKDTTSIGLEKNQELIAVFAYNNYYKHRSVQMHFAGVGRWCIKEFLRIGIAYPFKQLKVAKILGFIDSTNIKSISFVNKIGAKLEASIKDVGKYGDILIYSINKQQCKIFNRLENGYK